MTLGEGRAYVALYTDASEEDPWDNEEVVEMGSGYTRKAMTWTSTAPVVATSITFPLQSGSPWNQNNTTWQWDWTRDGQITVDKPALVPLSDYSSPDGQYYEYWKLGYQHGVANKKRPAEYREHKDHFSFAFNQGYREGKEFLKMRKALGGS